MSAGTANGHLTQGLKQRHMTMIAFGGVIGAGLFVGSGAVIHETGPAAVLSYLLAGTSVVLVMRMLGEMAVANPTVGSFAEYARESVGGWAGLLRRLAVLVLLGHRRRRSRRSPRRSSSTGSPACRSGAGARPDRPPHADQHISVRSYGEFEFWFASIKVIAIVVFLGVAAAYVLGLGSGEASTSPT